jgi:hypothetical protein
MLVHVIMEGSFLYVSLTGTAETSDFPLAFLCTCLPPPLPA